MKFIINRDEILTPLMRIVNIVEKKQTKPILSNVLLQVDHEQMIMIGTDLEVQLVLRVNVSSSESGSTTVSARKFLDICRLLPNNAEINFECSQDRVKIIASDSRFFLSCLPAHDFPVFSDDKYDNSMQINAGKFQNAINKTLFNIALQDFRIYLNGLSFSISNSKIRLVGSDGHRLAFCDVFLDQSSGIEDRLILPKKFVSELVKFIDHPEDALLIEFSSVNIKVTLSDLVFSSKLIDSKYPDFSVGFHQNFHEGILLDKQILKNAVSRVAILTNEKNKAISLEVQTHNLKMSAHNPEHEEADEVLQIPYDGMPFCFSLNPQYLLDALANIDSDMISLAIASNSSCCLVDEPEESHYRFLIMSMKL